MGHKGEQLGHQHRWLYFILMVLAAAPFFKGLFQPHHQLAFLLMMMGAVGIFLLVRRHNVKEMESLLLLDYLVFALAALYLLSVFWAVNPRTALQEALKQLLYVSTYWIVSRTAAKQGSWLLKAIALLMTFVAAATAVTASGMIPYNNALLSGRFGGPFQYPNTLAGYLFLGIFITLALRSLSSDLKAKLGWGAALAVQAVVFFFTYSRWSWLISPIPLVAMVALTPRERRGSLLAGLAGAAVAVVSILVPMDRALRGSPTMILPWVIAGVVVAVGVEALLHVVRGRLRWVLAGTAGIGVIGAIAVLAPQAAGLARRMATLSANDNSSLVRLWMLKDGVRAWWHQAPLLGLGGAGWNSTWLTYRSFDYVSTVIHSCLVETLTELGIQGVLLLLLTWGAAFWLAWRYRSRETDAAARVLWTGGTVGLAALLMHTVVDFDLWYPAVTMMIYTMFGIMRATEPVVVARPKGRWASPWGRYAAVLGVVVIAVGSARLLMAASTATAATNLLRKGDGNGGVAKFQTALRLDPLDPALHSKYGNIMLQIGGQTQNRNDLEWAGQALQRATSLDPMNPSYAILLSRYNVTVGGYAQAVELAQRAVDLDPMSADTYGLGLDRIIAAVTESLEDGRKPTEVKGYLAGGQEILAKFEERRKSPPEGVPSSLYMPPEKKLLDLKRAEYLALSGDLDQAAASLGKLKYADKDLERERYVWWVAVDRSLGNRDRAAANVKRLQGMDQNWEAQVDALETVLEKASRLR